MNIKRKIIIVYIIYMDNYNETSIRAMLKGYKRLHTLKDIKLVPFGTFLRYFTKRDNDGTYAFKSGGILFDRDMGKKYIKLYNNGVNWSVQLNEKNILFAEMEDEENLSHHITITNYQRGILNKCRDVEMIKYKDKPVLLYKVDGKLIKPSKIKLKENIYVYLRHKYDNKVKKYEGQLVSVDDYEGIPYCIGINVNMKHIDYFDVMFYHVYITKMKCKDAHIDEDVAAKLANL
jgi:hypothetical protein